jgi:hypothetical protein
MTSATVDALELLRHDDPHAAAAIDDLRAGLDERYLRQLTPSLAERVAIFLAAHPELRPSRRRRLPGWPATPPQADRRTP